jgi:hypothetical protein
MRCEAVLRFDQGGGDDEDSFLGRARRWGDFLERRELRRVEDRPAARRAIERRHRLPSGILYALRYRPPKRLAIEVYERLRQAVIAAGQSEQRALEDAIDHARRCGVDVDSPAMRAAEAVLRDARGTD